MSEINLYERLGGEVKIRALAATIFDNHVKNPLINPRYGSSNREDVIRLVSEFVCAGTGGPQTYTGRDMVTAHRGMNINEQEFVAVLDDILAALNTHNIPQREQEEFMMIAYSLKDEIIRR